MVVMVMPAKTSQVDLRDLYIKRSDRGFASRGLLFIYINLSWKKSLLNASSQEHVAEPLRAEWQGLTQP